MNDRDIIKSSFTSQAEKFATYHMSKAEYTDHLIEKINASGDETVLEVAAGTCICGRALAPHVKNTVCLDLTEAMLEQGRKLAAAENIRNISFIEGDAEELPFDDEAFDLVITRLSLHHFSDPDVPFGEMRRVLKKGGRLVVWDMMATAEELREVNDRIERMRDNSHVRILSREELEKMFDIGLELQTEEITYVSVELQGWMELTDTPGKVRAEIVRLMTEDMNGGDKTGFYPYVKDGQIYFDHRWLLLIGVKR